MVSRSIVMGFSLALFVSSFLIFSVQPVVSKMLLPILGGSPSVWNTCMVFFQLMLLGGYAYAHFLTKLKLTVHRQAILHLILLAVLSLFLPFALPHGIEPPDDKGQNYWQFGIMLTVIGGPFFVLSACAPMLQRWFAQSDHPNAASPYFLYAVSNVGSFLALLSYPLVFERFLTLAEQSQYWTGLYYVLIVLIALCAYLSRPTQKDIAVEESAEKTTWRQRGIWIALSFVPSSLLLGVTTYITTDIAAVPMLWIAPLALYLVTFIIAFSQFMTNRANTFALLLNFIVPIILTVFIFLYLRQGLLITSPIAVHIVLFFFCALLCHGRLAQVRPDAVHLTEYYLLISLGGVLGGAFNTFVAPVIFVKLFEYPIMLACTGILSWFVLTNIKPETIKDRVMISINAAFVIALCYTAYKLMALPNAYVFTCLLIISTVLALRYTDKFTLIVYGVCLISFLIIHRPFLDSAEHILVRKRNYFGTLTVYERNGFHYFRHGSTEHGQQSTDPDFKTVKLAYYSEYGPAGDIFRWLDQKPGAQRVADLGLGVGTLACYTRKDRTFDFYEIDKDVVDIAEDKAMFSYLSDCKSEYKVILGDGRLQLAKAEANSYDLAVFDAFSSDNIPIHLVTRDAIAVYLEKVRENGIVAINISNRYFDLRPILSAASKDLGVTFLYKNGNADDIKGTSFKMMPSIYAVLIKNPRDIAYFENKGWKKYEGRIVRAWTDDYASILDALIVLHPRKNP